MRLLISIIILIASIATISAQEPLITDSVEEPEMIKVEGVEVLPGLSVNAKVHDLGSIYFGGSVQHDFVITNSSSEEIKIINVRSDCGCSVELKGDKQIAPGNNLILSVTYEPEFRVGEVSKRITVYTDIKDKNSPGKWFELTMNASIVSLVNLDPGHVYFKKVHFGKEATESITITQNDDKTAQVIEAKANSEHLSVELIANSKPKGWTLNLTLKDTAPVGRFSDTVTLTTNSDNQKTIEIDVLGFVRGTVSVRPTQSYLGTLTPGESIEKTFKVVQTDDAADLIEPSISNAPEWLKYTVNTETEGKHYDIVVTFTVPKNETGRFGGTFLINVGHPTLKEFEVPVFGYILDPSMIKSDTKKEDPVN